MGRPVIAVKKTPIENAVPTTNEVVEDVEKKMEQKLQETIDELKDFKMMVKGMCNTFIERLTDAKKEIRDLKRTQKKPRAQPTNQPKKPSVFETPIALSPALNTFLKLADDDKLSRNDVTHRIHGYCKTHGLLEDKDQRIIHPDAALDAVLSPRPEGEKLTFFNIQRYLKHNYEL